MLAKEGQKPDFSVNLIVILLAFTQVVHILDFVVIMPLGPVFMREFSISPKEFGLLVSAYSLSASISGFLAILWLDRVNRKHAMLLLIAGFITSTALCSFATNAITLGVGRLLAGLFGGVMGANTFAIVSDIIPETRRGSAMGLLGAAFPIVSIAGIPLCLWLAEQYSWRFAFYLVIILAMIAALLAVLALPSLPPREYEASTPKSSRLSHRLIHFLDTYKSVIFYRPHLFGILTLIPVVLGGFTIVPYIAPFLIQNELIRENQLSLIYLIGGAITVFTSRWIGHQSDKHGAEKVFVVVAIAAILSIANFTNLQTTSFFFIILSCSLMMISLPGRIVALMAILSLIARPHQRGAYMALVSSLQSAVLGIASIIGGYLITETAEGRIDGYWKAGVFAIAANLIAIYLIIGNKQYSTSTFKSD